MYAFLMRLRIPDLPGTTRSVCLSGAFAPFNFKAPRSSKWLSAPATLISLRPAECCTPALCTPRRPRRRQRSISRRMKITLCRPAVISSGQPPHRFVGE